MAILEQARHKLEHLTANERKALEVLIARLKERYGEDLLRVVLFGSKARGDFDEESDLDLLIVVRMSKGNYRRHWNEIVNIIWEVEFAFNLVPSVIVKDEAGYKKMREDGLLLARSIEQDGIRLWIKTSSE